MQIDYELLGVLERHPTTLRVPLEQGPPRMQLIEFARHLLDIFFELALSDLPGYAEALQAIVHVSLLLRVGEIFAVDLGKLVEHPEQLIPVQSPAVICVEPLKDLARHRLPVLNHDIHLTGAHAGLATFGTSSGADNCRRQLS